MKVAIVAEWYPSPADPVHGIWAHRQTLASIAAGAELRVLVMRRPVPPLSVARRLWAGELGAFRAWARGTRRDLRGWSLDGVAVTPVPWLGPPRPWSYGAWGWWMALPLARALSRLRAEWDFDLVHAHTLAPAGFATALWARRTGVPLVLSAHGPDMSDVPFRSPIGLHAVSDAAGAADLVLANSSWARGRCIELGARPDRVQTLHLGADLAGSAPSAGVGGAAPSVGVGGAERLRLVTVAHLQARKGHATVLRALAALAPERRPSYRVIGDGEERGRLEALAASLDVSDHVHFAGQLSHPAALAALADCDLFVMPGVDEPFGVAFVEAMAAGLPVVGGRGEGGPEDISAAGPGMLLVTPGDVDELVELLGRCDGDRAELAALGAAARETAAASFTWDRCGQRTVAAYERVLSAVGVPGVRQT